MQSALLPHSAFAPVFCPPDSASHDVPQPRRSWRQALLRWLGLAGYEPN